MMVKKAIMGVLLALSSVLLSSCGRRVGTQNPSQAAQVRDFPMVEVPSMMSGETERMEYAVSRYWNAFTDTAKVYSCDSVTVNGVPLDDVEAAMGMYVRLLQMVPADKAVAAVDGFYSLIDAFERSRPGTNVFEELVRLTSKYLYDANSPVRDEQLYLPFVSRLGESDLIDNGYRMGYEWDARMCALNLPGTPAADFSFTDTRGKVQTLYGIRSEKTLLIFGNPGCTACLELMRQMDSDPHVSAQIADGSLKVVDIYIDEEVSEWKAHTGEYPKSWINGYDHGGVIRRDLIYNVRAIPSLYLLDSRKIVILKDAPADRVLSLL